MKTKLKPWDKVIYHPFYWKLGHKHRRCIVLRQCTSLRYLVSTDDKTRELLIAPKYYLKKIENFKSDDKPYEN